MKIGHCFGSHVATFIPARLNGKWKELGTVEKIRGSKYRLQNLFVFMDNGQSLS